MPMIYCGRGALGTDVVALTSGKGIVILGADEEALNGILGCADGYDAPICILTDNDAPKIREGIALRYSDLLRHVFISPDPLAVAKHMAEELRKRHFAAKI